MTHRSYNCLAKASKFLPLFRSKHFGIKMTAANHVAYTAPINRPGAMPVLSINQVWTVFQHRIVSAETFVGGAITGTNVISTSTNSLGNVVTEREFIFRDGNR